MQIRKLVITPWREEGAFYTTTGYTKKKMPPFSKQKAYCVRVIHIQLSFPSNYRALGFMKHGAESNGTDYNHFQ